ncbi:hypothetical protein Droror1_Dr00019642 [Drosera rotundifolia]
MGLCSWMELNVKEDTVRNRGKTFEESVEVLEEGGSGDGEAFKVVEQAWVIDGLDFSRTCAVVFDSFEVRPACVLLLLVVALGS